MRKQPQQQGKRLGQESAKRLMMYSAAAGMGAFGFGSAAQGAITVYDPADFGVQGAAKGWVSETTPNYGGQSKGVDILQNGATLDVGFFQGSAYGGYLIARTDIIGYYTPSGGSMTGSGQVGLLNNPANPDGNGPANSLDGFNAGEIIGDDDTDASAAKNNMRLAYYGGDWQGVPSNGVDPSYIGFKIDIDNDTVFDGFGWIEVIVNDPGSMPTITLTRWAYTDDGSTIAAGQVPEPGTLMLLAAGAGAMGLRRRK